MPDYIPLTTTPQATLPRFSDSPDFATKQYANDVAANVASNFFAATIQAGNYGGVSPTYIPSVSPALALDTSVRPFQLYCYVSGIGWQQVT